MSIECSECERDARGPHNENCVTGLKAEIKASIPISTLAELIATWEVDKHRLAEFDLVNNLQELIDSIKNVR